MEKERITPDKRMKEKDGVVLGMLAREIGKRNKGRNRILFCAALLCVVTLSVVFGISTGKIEAEYTKAVRQAGTAASAELKGADENQYNIISSLDYVKEAGRRIIIGNAAYKEQDICEIQMLDEPAWENLVKPAYTDVEGHYPQEEGEIILSRRALDRLGIQKPEEGMEIALTVSVGLFRSEEETFRICGWYTEYTDEALTASKGYVSEKQLRKWGIDLAENGDVILCQSDAMDWKKAEEQLYRDVPRQDESQVFTVSDTAAYGAVSSLAGGYKTAALGALVLLAGMVFLVCNVLQVSMAGDIRQMGLLNTIGATKKQLGKIYRCQIRWYVVRGAAAGAVLSFIILWKLLPAFLGKQYLNGYGGGVELSIFHWEILTGAVLFALFAAEMAASGVIRHTIGLSCVESMHFTGAGKKRGRKDKEKEIHLEKIKKRSGSWEIFHLAWQRLGRRKLRFWLTVFSLFLGMEAFLASVVITEGNDYRHAIEQRPDFVIAGEFSDWAKEEGYGLEYKSRDIGEDPMETKGHGIALLSDNAYDGFSPISSEVKEKLLEIQGIEWEKSRILEGAYVWSAVSAKAARPLSPEGMPQEEMSQDEMSGEGGNDGGNQTAEENLIEGFTYDTVHILTEQEIEELEEYVEENQIPADMEQVRNGTGVLLLHDHQFSPEQEEELGDSLGEPVQFQTMAEKKSEIFALSGYLDNRADGFPDIPQTWHGAEGMLYYLVSEEGFAKIPTEKKTLYMELYVENEREQQIQKEIQSILAQENRLRDEKKETGIFCISKSELEAVASGYLEGNRLILGSISVVLFIAGLANYFNVMAAGILSGKRELLVMEQIGMTKRQKKNMLRLEGLYYCVFVAALMATAGTAVLEGIRIYFEERVSYFVFTYPVGWTFLLLGGLSVICICVPGIFARYRK